MTQKEFHAQMLQCIEELTAVLQLMGYTWDTSLRECPHETAKVAKRLHKISTDCTALRTSAANLLP